MDPITFGERLRRLREERGWSQRELSAQTANQEIDGRRYPRPLAQFRISRQENGTEWTHRPHPATVARLATALEVQVATLLGEGPVTLREYLLDSQERTGKSDEEMAALVGMSLRQWTALKRARHVAVPWTRDQLALIAYRLPADVQNLVMDELRRLGRGIDEAQASAESQAGG